MSVNPIPQLFHYRIARSLCTSITDVLLPATDTWFRRAPPVDTLHVRVGRGRATYCERQRDSYTITFGVRMVTEKCEPALAAQWLTAHEMQRRGYCAGQPNIGELLAHTACHEFAHLVQQSNGWLRRGSVHNRFFYELLDRLHESGMARAVLAHLASDWADGVVNMQTPVPPTTRPRRAAPPEHSFRKGDRVWFVTSSGRRITGQITRINRVTASVSPEDARYRISYYRVPFHLLRSANA